MHFHEFEHISGVIAKVFKEKKKVIEGFEIFPIEIIDGTSISYQNPNLGYSYFEAAYYILGKDLDSEADLNKVTDYRVYTLINENDTIKIITPIDHYLREGEKYSTQQMSAGPFGCIPISANSVFPSPKCIKDDDGKKYVRFEKAGLKNEKDGREFEATLLVRDEDRKVCDLIDECSQNEGKLEGAIYGKRRFYWPFNVVKAHAIKRVKINGNEKEYWVIDAKKVVFKCV